MNFVQALRYGKRFRRKGYAWIHAEDVFDRIDMAPNRYVSKEGLLADDWEVEGEVDGVTLTGAEFVKRYEKVMKDVPSLDLMKALGFY